MALESVRDPTTYRRLCAKEESIPLFSQAWWLDAVSGAGQWNVVLAYRGDEVVGALPYVAKRKLGWTFVTQPKLTQTLGPWVRPSAKSYPKALAFEKDVLQALSEGLPPHHHYAQSWHHTRQNWLPFYWHGFEQTTRYTYRLSGLENEQAAWKGLQNNVQSDIRKARDRFDIKVRRCVDLEEFLTLNRKVFERQGKRMPYPEALVASVDRACVERNSRDIWIAVSPDGALHATAYIVRSGDTAYYLMGGSDPALRSSGATSLCIWEAIRNQPEHIHYFDFEGSMLEPVERYFRAFGAQQVPYFRVTRTSSRFLGLVMCARRLWGASR